MGSLIKSKRKNKSKKKQLDAQMFPTKKEPFGEIC